MLLYNGLIWISQQFCEVGTKEPQDSQIQKGVKNPVVIYGADDIKDPQEGLKWRLLFEVKKLQFRENKWLTPQSPYKKSTGVKTQIICERI